MKEEAQFLVSVIFVSIILVTSLVSMICISCFGFHLIWVSLDLVERYFGLGISFKDETIKHSYITCTSFRTSLYLSIVGLYDSSILVLGLGECSQKNQHATTTTKAFKKPPFEVLQRRHFPLPTYYSHIYSSSKKSKPKTQVHAPYPYRFNLHGFHNKGRIGI